MLIFLLRNGAQGEERKGFRAELRATKKHSASAWSDPSHFLPSRALSTSSDPDMVHCSPGTHSRMSPALVAVSTQPFQGSLHLKFNILSSESVPCHGKATDGLGCHFHDNWVIGREEVPKVVSKSSNSSGIPAFHSYEAGWKRQKGKR